MTTPLVSIVCITYNHEKYIKQCLDGFFMQKTNFDFEILIHDDASTDKTADIIRLYEKKYPGIIKPIYQLENQYSKGVNPGNLLYPLASGKYIAVCEGDDYWTDPMKLQKQVDFLEVNSDCSLCFHASKSIRNNNPKDYILHSPKEIPLYNKFEMKHVILGGGGFMATNSMLFYREHILDRPAWMETTPVGDFPLMLLLASKGTIGYIDDVMSVYRVLSSQTSWSFQMQNSFLRRIKHHNETLKYLTEFNKWSNKKYNTYIKVIKKQQRLNFIRGSVIRLIRVC